MIQKVRDFIARHALLPSDGMLLVALSGGADSVALLRVLLALGYRVEAMHCNFQLRGEESQRDEDFCRALCQKLGIELHLAHFDTRSYAKLHHVSIEMAARTLRYNYFHQLLRDLNAAAICVAHHSDDQAETVLLNLVRGTGIEGLKGMLPRNGAVVRPLLVVSRNEIVAYLEKIGQDYITDSTNLIADVARNQLRLKVFPLLRSINPMAPENIARAASHVADALGIVEEGTEKALKNYVTRKGDSLDINWRQGLRKEKGSHTLLWRLLSSYGFRPAQVDRIYACETGGIFNSDRYQCYSDRGWLLVRPPFVPMEPFRIPEPGNYFLPDSHRITLKLEKVTPDFHPSRDPNIATLDAARVRFPLVVRHTQQGDAFIPYGMSGRKLVSDFLTDLKVALPDKRRQLVVASPDCIIWLPTRRTAQTVAVTKETTEVLTITIIEP